MTTTKSGIAVHPNNQPTFNITLESTGIFLGILVSFSALLGGIIKAITKFNSIDNNLRDLREDFNTHVNAEGHNEILKQVK
ncbi:hypothetical protein LC605_30075, partial [Nostoc sp. CHAB 5836]|nr:hypothetical protein [Nostoc sp. CHAB 5836]